MRQRSINPLRHWQTANQPRQISAWFVWLALICLLSGGCISAQGNRPNPIEAVDSPQNDRTLVVAVNTSRDDPTRYLTLVFEVRDKASGDLLHRQQTSAASRMAWSMRWLDNRTVQLDSSDVGTYCWQEQGDGAWLELHCP